MSSRDKDVVKQVEEMERFKALITRLKEQQNSKQDRIDSFVAEVKILQEQLQQAYRANSCKEVCIIMLISVPNSARMALGFY